MFSPVNTTLTTVGLEQNLDKVAVTYVDTQPDTSGIAGAPTTITVARDVTLTAVTNFPTIVVSGNKITGYYTDCFDNTIKYRTKDDKFVTTKKWTDIAMAIADNTLSELYYYKADPRTRITYNYVASVSPSPLTSTYLNVPFVNGVATVALSDINGLFVGGVNTKYDYNTVISNCKVTVKDAGGLISDLKYTENLELEFAPSTYYNHGDGVYGAGYIIVDVYGNSESRNEGPNSFRLNPGRKIVTNSDGRTLTFTLDMSNAGRVGLDFYGDGFIAPGTFYADIIVNYVTGKTYNINVDNDWNKGRNQLIKYTNLTKYQQEYLVQWINSNSDKVTWINNVLEAVEWENNNL